MPAIEVRDTRLGFENMGARTNTVTVTVTVTYKTCGVAAYPTNATKKGPERSGQGAPPSECGAEPLSVHPCAGAVHGHGHGPHVNAGTVYHPGEHGLI